MRVISRKRKLRILSSSLPIFSLFLFQLMFSIQPLFAQIFKPSTKAELQTAVDAWCENSTQAITIYNNISLWDTSLITSMSSLFSGKKYFNDYIGGWNTTRVTNMYKMFYDAWNFNQDIGGWDTSSVISMKKMFEVYYHAQPTFNQDLSQWDTSKVTNMEAMFSSARGFDGNVSTWDTSQVKSMKYMFYHMRFKGDVSKWNVSLVASMFRMFDQNGHFQGELRSWDVRSNLGYYRMLNHYSYKANLCWEIHPNASAVSSSLCRCPRGGIRSGNSAPDCWTCPIGTIFFDGIGHNGACIGIPTSAPSGQPSGQPSRMPSGQPTNRPTGQPSSQPSGEPSGQPSSQPTGPSGQPSSQPTGQPSGQPSSQPTGQPSSQPTAQPTGQPSSQPTGQPSLQPTGQPSGQPTVQPTAQPSGQPTGQPTGQPSSEPTSAPSCGMGSEGNPGNCRPCEPGYSSPSFLEPCIACPAGTFGVDEGMSFCNHCPWPYHAIFEGATQCEHINLSTSSPGSGGLYYSFLGIFILGIILSPGCRLQAVLCMLPPALDFSSDVAYILEASFYNEIIFITAIVFLFLCNIQFIYILHSKTIYPAFICGRFALYFPGYYITDKVIFLSYVKGTMNPQIGENPWGKTFEKHDTIPKVIVWTLQWILLLLLQLANVILLIVWIPLNFVFECFCFCVGIVLFQLKVLCVNRVWNIWVKYFTGCEDHMKDTRRLSVDTFLLNESIVMEFASETIPQLMIQGINNTLTREWGSVLTIFSFFMSSFLIINTSWRYGYYVLYQGFNIKDVPLSIVEIDENESVGNSMEFVSKAKDLVKVFAEESFDIVSGVSSALRGNNVNLQRDFVRRSIFENHTNVLTHKIVAHHTVTEAVTLAKYNVLVSYKINDSKSNDYLEDVEEENQKVAYPSQEVTTHVDIKNVSLDQANSNDMSSYKLLNEKHELLIKNHNELNEKYDSLNEEHESFIHNYNELNEKHESFIHNNNQLNVIKVNEIRELKNAYSQMEKQSNQNQIKIIQLQKDLLKYKSAVLLNCGSELNNDNHNTTKSSMSLSRRPNSTGVIAKRSKSLLSRSKSKLKKKSKSIKSSIKHNN